MQVDNTDSASLHFESILKSDINKVGDMSNDSIGHSFLFDNHENYHIPRINANAVALNPSMASYENTDANNENERKRPEFAHKYPNYSQPNNELSDNAFFNKFHDAANECVASAGDSNDVHQAIDDDDLNGKATNDDDIYQRKT